MNNKYLYPNLTRAMRIEGVSKNDIADLLGIHFNTVTAKLEGETTSHKNKYQIGFTFIEATTIYRAYFSNYDFLQLFSFSLDQTA